MIAHINEASIATIKKYFALATLCGSEIKSALDNEDNSFNFSTALKISDDNLVILSFSNFNPKSLSPVPLNKIIKIMIFCHAQRLKITTGFFIVKPKKKDLYHIIR
jgi:hypothetical protein